MRRSERTPKGGEREAAAPASGPAPPTSAVWNAGRAITPAQSTQPAEILLLQRSVGNRAIHRLLADRPAAPSHDVSRVPERIQRDVGFEFEVQGTELWTGALRGGEGDRKKLAYADKVYDVPGSYHIESDDGRVEFVTVPFPETESGKREMVSAVTRAAGLAKRAPEMATPLQPAVKLAAWTLRAGGKKVHADNPWVGDFGSPDSFPGSTDATWAKPQTSFGVPLEKLIALAEAMMAGDTYHEGLTKYEPIEGADAKAGEREWAEGFLDRTDLGTVSNVSSVRGYIGLLLTYIDEAQSAYEDRADPEHAGQKKRYPMRYPKGVATLMARTNFRVMFDQVKDQWPPKLAKRADLYDMLTWFSQRDLGDQLYPYGYYDDAADPSLWFTPEGDKWIVEGPTMKEWLDSVFTDAELVGDTGGNVPAGMDGRTAPHLPGTPEKRGMGASTKMDKVETRAKDTDPLTMVLAPIFEFRGFAGPYPPDTWTRLAVSVFDLIHRVNALVDL